MTEHPTVTAEAAGPHPSACILCECNCGLQITVGSDRRFEKIHGDERHPASAPGTRARRRCGWIATRTVVIV